MKWWRGMHAINIRDIGADNREIKIGFLLPRELSRTTGIICRYKAMYRERDTWKLII